MKCVVASYDIASRKIADRVCFVCGFCGKFVERRLSKVKNPEKVFCDNACRAKYAERESLIKKTRVDEKSLILDFNQYEPLIKKLYGEIVHKGDYEESFDAFFQTARISIWKSYNMAHNGKGSILSYYAKGISNGWYNYIRQEHPKPKDVSQVSLEEYEETYDRIPADDKKDVNPLMEKIIRALKQKKAKSFEMLYLSEFEGLCLEELANRYKISKRDVSVNIYNAKKMMRKELVYEL